MSNEIDLRKQRKVDANVSVVVGEVEIKNDSGNPIPTKEVLGTTGTQTTVARSATSVTILASNANRREAYIRNETVTNLWINYGTPALVNKGIKIPAGDAIIVDNYIGIITGIWTSGGSGNAEIIEVV